jgi:hypothetical protein
VLQDVQCKLRESSKGRKKCISVSVDEDRQTFVTVLQNKDNIKRSLTKVSKTRWPQSGSQLYQPSGSSLSAKLVPTFADRKFGVVSATDPCGRTLEFLDKSR